MSEAPGMDASFDSKEDYEMYMRLMSERRKIQVALEDKKRQKKEMKLKKEEKLREERERGFQVCFSGANAERIDEARRRDNVQKGGGPQEDKRGFPPSLRPTSGAGKEWAMATVELRGQDGQVFRTSPGMGGEPVQENGKNGKESYSDDCFEVASDDDAICEELPGSRGVSPSVRTSFDEEGSSSRPVSAGSRVDQDTRGVLRVMETANPDQLMLLRESLTKNIERRVAAASPMSRMRALSNSGRNLLQNPERSRPSSAAHEMPLSRPSSSSSAIAEAIQAENARVKAMHGQGNVSASDAGAAGADSSEVQTLVVEASSSSRPPSRPNSGKTRKRLPLSPEAALESAPPSVLSGTAPTRRPPMPGGSSGYLAAAPSMEAGSGGYSASLPPAASDPPPIHIHPIAGSAPARAEEPELLDRVSRLDRKKQKALLRVLDTLEAEKSTSRSPPKAQAVVAVGASLGASPSEARAPSPPIAASPRRDFSQVQPTLGASALRLRVVSNWGSARQCGLSLIEAFDKMGEVLRIPPAALSLHGTQSGSTTLPRLIEGMPHGTAEKTMWVATVCPSQAPLDGPPTAFEPFELVLSLPESAASPAALKLWNFNSPDGLEKGARDVELWRNGEQVWTGQIPVGSGTADNSPALAVLDPGFRQPPSEASAGSAVDISSSFGPAMSSSGVKDRPIWLDGATSSSHGQAVTEDAPWDPAPTLGGPLAQPVQQEERDLSPKPMGRRQSGPTKFDKELEMSLQALEQFRSSQSRRFFASDFKRAKSQDYGNGLMLDAGANPVAPGMFQSAEDWRPEACDRGAIAGNGGYAAGGPAPSPSPVEGMAASYTADFGGRPPRPGKVDSPEVVTDSTFTIDGLGAIPVLNFEGGCDEGAIDDQSQPVLGASMCPASMTQSLVIPTTPCGRTLVFNCVSTWGDQNFVGLAGIEIFDSRGMPVVLKDVMRQVTAHPPSINVLPEYQHDPRTVDKLFDQVNLTRDDLHVWLAPFFPGQAHTVTIDLERETHLSMIRVWNYNKSRLHSSRGVRDLEILLDSVPVFVGEIQQAPGCLTEPEQACEHILFTQDEAVLQVIEEHDWLPAHLPLESDDEDEGEDADDLDVALRELAAEGPLTADAQGNPQPNPFVGTTGSDGRPITQASHRVTARGSVCENITLVIHSTWGDAFYVGLTSIELLDTSLLPIPLEPEQIDASPRDLNDLEGIEGDPRTIDKCLDNVCCTTDDHHMWLAPFNKVPASLESRAALNGNEASLPRNLIRFDFGGEKLEVAGFHIWNYNKNVEDTCRGVKEFSVYCDEKYIGTFLCRKAPGHVHFDFKQVILLDQPPCMDTTARRALVQGVPPVAPRMPSRGRDARHRSVSRDGRPREGGARAASRERPRSRDGTDLSSLSTPANTENASVNQQYETPLHPVGFVFRLVFLSSWSDAHYIGLDGIELYNLEGRAVRPHRVHSNHGSVRNLPGMQVDIRTEDNLLEGAPGSSGRMWLAPCVRQPPNFIELVFDEPAHISCMKFWNYTRTPSRGARDIEIYVDDLLVYQGILRQEDGGVGSARGEAVLFTKLPNIVARERSFVYNPSMEEIVSFFDDSWNDQNSRQAAGSERPMTAVTHQK